MPAVFLYAPIISGLSLDRQLRSAGLETAAWKKAGADFLGFAAVILPCFLAAWWALFRYGFDQHFVFAVPEQVAVLGMGNDPQDTTPGLGLDFSDNTYFDGAAFSVTLDGFDSQIRQ